ncbi:MAG: valine--tRNA ligase [Deltaproteobacteria bacterium]|nr:valine--tRNA ligase [Deltaproteobacteria bacterium]
MPRELPKAYEPHEVEKKWSEFWIQKGYFHAEATSSRPPFCIVIPPPNVTGSLHMGHALNNTLQDILCRYKRMKGFNVLWMPGTDHAGIATQNVVERELKKEGKSRHDLGREKFIERVWEWKERHGNQIIHQLKRLGASCDWSRERFTMDDGLSRAVREEFVRLYEEGLIERDDYIVNWCPRCQTVLSDIEVTREERAAEFVYIKYGPLTLGTVRPETKLGDTGIAVHPDDERYKKYVGKTLEIDSIGGKIQIQVVADEAVDPEFGTGVVKVTPAHDPVDFEIGKRHNLPVRTVIGFDAKMTSLAGKYAGMDRFECRKKIVEELQELGLIEKIEPYKHAVGLCYRCHTVVEPLVSKQWFVRTKSLAKNALEAVQDGKTKFFPDQWTKTYQNWMNEIRDWCISRQLWWGHRIPAWYCDKKCPPIVSRTTPTSCPACRSTNLQQDPDVLDTWFSSALWPFSTLGWPDQTPELKTFYPTSVLITGFDIIFFWIARMMMMGMKFMGEVPFRDVYIHALVRDAEGQKMSKSKGNVIDPLSIMDQYGTDAFRFTLAVLAVPGRDVKLSPQVIEGYRNFCNKIWNATRYFLSQEQESSREVLSLYDKWILQQWNYTLQQVVSSLETYRFDEAAKAIYRFFWHTFCDWYVEFSKVRSNQSVFGEILAESLKVLHPFMPFITEEIWQSLREKGESESITVSSFPEMKKWNYQDEIRPVERMIQVITALRTIRGENQIPVSAALSPTISFQNEGELRWFQGEEEMVRRLTRSDKVIFSNKKVVAKQMAHISLGGLDVYVPLSGLVDLGVEKKRLEKEIKKLKEDEERRNKKLSDLGFLQHAQPEVISLEKEHLQVIREKIQRMEETFQNL